ncbi:MAG: GTP-binding protein [Catonella sp.]|nr:GTP-binding protein [Catonella sp.]MDY6356116.1 GTP-binding protein [Catonella sp.]
MTKIDIISGFLGAGKTTLIKKLIKESFGGQQVVLIENEFGEIGIDGGFLKEAGIQITEMNSGCICCSLVGDFGKALKEVVDKYHPDRIIIEPSGVGKLSDVIKAVARVQEKLEGVVLNSFVAVVDGTKTLMYMKNFGEFFNNQIENANTIVISRTQKMTDDKLKAVVAAVREHNPKAVVITTPWDDLTGDQIVKAMEQGDSLVKELVFGEDDVLDEDGDEHEHHHHHHHHDDDDHDHEHEDHDDDDDDDDDDDHDHDGHEHHHHHHHHGHDADEIFDSWGTTTPQRFEKDALDSELKRLAENKDGEFGVVLRAKGILQTGSGSWLEFDLTPEEYEIRENAAPDVTGKLCVIGSNLDHAKLSGLFGVEGRKLSE